MKVRLCGKNKGKGGVKRRLREKYPELDVKVKKCVGICGECSRSKVARVDGKKTVAADKDGLYRKIVEVVEKD